MKTGKLKNKAKRHKSLYDVFNCITTSMNNENKNNSWEVSIFEA